MNSENSKALRYRASTSADTPKQLEKKIIIKFHYICIDFKDFTVKKNGCANVQGTSAPNKCFMHAPARTFSKHLLNLSAQKSPHMCAHAQ